jgi:2-polyprenyl-3-methyl-5-hydroxy-6-metoxy-1,4-benzoquinol methylase
VCRRRSASVTVSDRDRQRQYFEDARHQYPRASVLHPPLHTAIELGRVLAALGNVQGTVVDLGAGTGRLSIALARAGYRVLAVDVSSVSLAVLSGVADELGLTAISTATELPRGARFEGIVGADILHHIDLDEYLPVVHSSLREAGKVVFSEPGGWNPAWYVFLPLFHDMSVERNIVTCNVRNLRRCFERHGYRDVRITGVGVLPRPLFGWNARGCSFHDQVGNWPGLKLFAYRYLVEARR